MVSSVTCRDGKMNVQSTAIERRDEIGNALPFHANVGGENVVGNGQRRGDELQRGCVQNRREARAELPHVDNDLKGDMRSQ